MKPTAAVKLALTELADSEDFTLDDIVSHAEENLGEELELYRQEFTRIALRKKASDMTRSWHNPADPYDGQLNMLGAPKRRFFRKKNNDGKTHYVSFTKLTWNEVNDIWEENKKKDSRRQNKNVTENEMFYQLQLIMEGTSLTVEKALDILKDRKAAE